MIGLPDRATLTLTEAISWLAWGRAFTSQDFERVYNIDFLADMAEALERGPDRTSNSLNYRLSLAEALSLPAAMEQASGFEFGTDEFLATLDRAQERLFEAVQTEALEAKVQERNGEWTTVPKDWFWPSRADPRPPTALLDANDLVRNGQPPLERIIAPKADRRIERWFDVHFERSKFAQVFAAAKTDAGEGSHIESGQSIPSVVSPTDDMALMETPATPDLSSATDESDEQKMVEWLTQLMKDQPDGPISKQDAHKLAVEDSLQRISDRAFDDRAWPDAVKASGAKKWSDAGPRRHAALIAARNRHDRRT